MDFVYFIEGLALFGVMSFFLASGYALTAYLMKKGNAVFSNVSMTQEDTQAPVAVTTTDLALIPSDPLMEAIDVVDVVDVASESESEDLSEPEIDWAKFDTPTFMRRESEKEEKVDYTEEVDPETGLPYGVYL